MKIIAMREGMALYIQVQTQGEDGKSAEIVTTRREFDRREKIMECWTKLGGQPEREIIELRTDGSKWQA